MKSNSSANSEASFLVYDGECGFCAWWIERWKAAAGPRVFFEPYQTAAARFPGVPAEAFAKSVYFFEPDQTSSGAEAVFRLRARMGRRWPLALYRHLPFFRHFSEMLYRLVADNRPLFSRLTYFFWGRDPRPDSYLASRWIFFKMLGAVYFAAFLSLLPQLAGLIGENGLTPAGMFLDAVGRQLPNAARFYAVPTLAWLNSSAAFLQALCWAGLLFSVLVIAGRAVRLSLFVLWALYLSILSVGQDFLSFQWDTLLLEAGLIAIFFCPGGRWGIFPDWNSRQAPFSRALVQFLAFKLMFLSGVVKLASGDPAWRDLTALAYHYETQPLPNLLSWFAHQLPLWFHKFSCAVMFAIELGAPFLLFAPRRLRHFAVAALCSLQLLIVVTGNYCFFNWLTIALCLCAADDMFWPAFFRSRFQAAETARGKWVSLFAIPAAAVFFFTGTAQIARPMRVRLPWTGAAMTLERLFYPFHSLNSYGLFAVMTKSRKEIFIEGSYDGEHWQAYGFKFKPGDPARLPFAVAPHQPRLDWQMWFAALGRAEDSAWFVNLAVRLIQGKPEALALLADNPFAGKPPRFIRAAAYDYKFTDFRERAQTGAWWKREYKGLYLPALELEPAGEN